MVRPPISTACYRKRNTRRGRVVIFKITCANHYFQGTTDVRIDPQLNKKVWEQGIKGVDYRIRVRISRKRNDEEGAKEKLYSYVQAVNVKDPKGLPTVVVEE
jgi:ribosomal protein L31E